MASILASRKDRVCTDLIAVHNGLLSAVQARREYAQAWTEFGTTACAMASLQIPQLGAQFTTLSGLFNEIAAIQNALADAEDRNADDFRDVFERFDVVFRLNDEYNAAKARDAEAVYALKELRARIATEREKPSWPKLEIKFTQQEAAARAERIAALERYKMVLALLLKAKIGYNRFKVRQLRHGWTLYADALREAAEKEIDAFGRIREHLRGLSLDGLSEAVDELAAAAPEPVPPEQIADALGAAAPAGDSAYD
jgi:hypothetical protein